MKSKTRNRFILIFLFSLILTISSISQNSKADIIPPTGIILFIGDGTGFNQIELARIVEYGPDGESAIFELPYQGSVSTLNIDGITTDSAASATAIGTGVKTRNGIISMNFDASQDLETILEIAQANNYSTGIVATCHLTHATPASFMAHDPARGNYIEIAEDISTAGVDVLLGGGSGSSYLGNYITEMESAGYDYITNKTELNDTISDQVLGLFTSTSFTPFYQRLETSTQPRLVNMTQKLIELLNNTGNPFFLMIEASQIDWGSHDNSASYAGIEAIEFEKSVKYVKGLAESDPNLTVLVTADHETGGLNLGAHNFLTSLPSEEDDYNTRNLKRLTRINEVSTSWTTSGHTTREVILAGMGPNTEKILEATHHIDTFSIMRELIDGKTEPTQYGNEGYVNLFVIAYLGILGISGALTGIITWLRMKRRK